jgi:hypothetical protein
MVLEDSKLKFYKYIYPFKPKKVFFLIQCTTVASSKDVIKICLLKSLFHKFINHIYKHFVTGDESYFLPLIFKYHLKLFIMFSPYLI